MWRGHASTSILLIVIGLSWLGCHSAAKRVVLVAGMSVDARVPADAGMAWRAVGLASRLVACAYIEPRGLFVEGMWQSANTLESLSNLMLVTGSTRWLGLLNNSFALNPLLPGLCYDDHLWWLISWVRAYEVSGIHAFLLRAAEIFDTVSANGWREIPCDGGVMWCPTGSPYINAITNELFLTSAMELHPYTGLLGRPIGYYLTWAQREWAWLSGNAHGMVGPDGLVNDGLQYVNGSCVNNNGTTWTYNQGVLLDGLAALAVATGDPTVARALEAIAESAMARLSQGGVLTEPCGAGVCDGDQQIFKGVFVRHLQRAVTMDVPVAPAAAAFVVANARSLLASAACGNGYFSTGWAGPCVDANATTAGASSALDLLVAAAGVPGASPAGAWRPIGLGACADAAGAAMPRCTASPASPIDCAAGATGTSGAVAYDWHANCSGPATCSAHTLAGPAACPEGWRWGPGDATNVTQSNGEELSMCFVR